VILGVPLYSRIWNPADLTTPIAVGLGTVEETAAGGTAELDPEWGIDRVNLPDGRFLWREDARLIADRIGWAAQEGLAGWAGWRLGLESASFWDLLAD
jgi:hypothetical protein